MISDQFESLIERSSSKSDVVLVVIKMLSLPRSSVSEATVTEIDLIAMMGSKKRSALLHGS